MLNSDISYENAYAHDTVYGAALDLLARYVDQERNIDAPGVHLDIGCGYGSIAEPLTTRLGLHYIGVDGAPNGPRSLRERGFEAHQAMFHSQEELLAKLKGILDGRRLTSISMLDTLEHLPEGDGVLNTLRELAQTSNIPVIISVPNVAHRDVGFRLALGQWDYTPDGLLDHTHTRLFNRAGLQRTLRFAGLHPVEFNDVKRFKSDQFFPDTLPSLATGTSLHRALAYLRDQVDDTANISQFVVIALPGPRKGGSAYLRDEEKSPARPFLSIITRTQGTRPHCLIELLTALAGQDDHDFELLIVAHKITIPQQLAIERIIEDCPEWLRNITRLIRENEGNRSRPLNRGFAEARGQYIAIHDDDDVPFAHWVSTFRKLASDGPGTMLRSVAARQETDIVEIAGRKGIRATSSFMPYPAHFDLLSHLSGNFSPNNTLAFPRGVFHDLNLRFDEDLTTTEDWDFLVRAAAIVGVTTSPEITSIYHWWKEGHQSSRSDHETAEWDANYAAILRKFDRIPIILPPGSAQRLRGVPTLHGANHSVLYRQVLSILTSTCWTITAPLRWAARVSGKTGSVSALQLNNMNSEELSTLLNELRNSRSWRLTRVIHRDKRT